MSVATEKSTVFEEWTLPGQINTDHEVLLSNVRGAIRRGHPQIWPTNANRDRIARVCGGPSLDSTFDALKQLYFEGAKVVTVNGSYHWCLDRNIRPSAQIVLDARAANARFLRPDVPHCRYYLCSNCAPATWDAVEGREHVAIWHNAVTPEIEAELDSFYQRRWHEVPGGTTVGTRAIGLLHTLGFLRFDVFGMDSCWMGERHHAYPQSENDADRRIRATVSPKDRPDLARDFYCAPWHVKQAEDTILFIRNNADRFLLNMHGDGMIAFMLASAGDVATTIEE